MIVPSNTFGNLTKIAVIIFWIFGISVPAVYAASIRVNQVGYNTNWPKTAIADVSSEEKIGNTFKLIDKASMQSVYKGTTGLARMVPHGIKTGYFSYWISAGTNSREPITSNLPKKMVMLLNRIRL
ncbi:MAG: cellulase N-terminal Ig-like domain-containing protein [Bacteroidota bacterium]|nr:cellulase N-terminal Ig-like domain-containing protein [Bacteroidota bacterium]